MNICVSQALRNRIRPPRPKVIYDPIHPMFRCLPGVAHSDRFTFVGRLIADKGCDVLLRALTECAQRGHRFGLDIYGEGPQKEKLEAQARELGLSGAVRFHGSVTGEDLVLAYNRSLGVVVPSLWEEPLGIVALEAMACGRAVIAASVGGLPEIVRSIELRFPRGNATALAERMLHVGQDASFRAGRQSEGEVFARNFQIDRIGDEYLAAYQAALESKPCGKQTSRYPAQESCHSTSAGPTGTRATVRSVARIRSGRVLLAHPGTQHSYQTALALQNAGLLGCYFTGFYYKPQSTLARGLRALCNGRSAWLERELLRRCQPGLAPENVRMLPLWELLYVGASHVQALQRFSGALLEWRNERFDWWVAQQLVRQGPAAVICYDTCARRAFEKAKPLGIRCVLDQSIAHIRASLPLLREETQLHPDLADSLPARVPEELVERCTQEALLADCILAASDYVRQSLLTIGVEASRIALVPYGVDVERFKPAPRQEHNKFRVLFVGHLSQRKGIKYLLEAVRGLRCRNLELLLLGPLMGSGKGLAPYAHLLTWIPPLPHAEIPQWFQQADLFVYPSLHEGSALSIYEALASGLPVITTPHSGSVVRDGVEGYIVPIRDVEALQEKIQLLYENAELRQEMSRQARARAEEFTWAAYGRRLADVLRQILRTDA